MATILDIGLLKHFRGAFAFLFVLILVYAALDRIEWFKEKKAVSAILALMLALLTLTSSIATETINRMIPWFVLFTIFGILLLVAFMAFGVPGEHITKIISGKEGTYGNTFFLWVLAIMLIIGLGTMFTVINEQEPIAGLQAGGTPSQEFGFFQTIFHPKVLGLAVVLLVGFFTIQQLTKK